MSIFQLFATVAAGVVLTVVMLVTAVVLDALWRLTKWGRSE